MVNRSPSGRGPVSDDPSTTSQSGLATETTLAPSLDLVGKI